MQKPLNPFEILELARNAAREAKPKAAAKSKDNVVGKIGKFIVARYETTRGPFGKKLTVPVTKVALKVECEGSNGQKYYAMVPVATVKVCMENPTEFNKGLLLLADAVKKLSAEISGG